MISFIHYFDENSYIQLSYLTDLVLVVMRQVSFAEVLWEINMTMVNTKSAYINELLSGVYDYIKRIDPYAYKNPNIDSTWIVVGKDELSVRDAYYMACCSGVEPTRYTDGTLISVVDYGDSYTVRYTPACSKTDVLKKFEDKYREADPVLMDAISDYFMNHDGTHLYADRKHGRIHYGVLQDDDSVYEGTIKL